MSFEKAFQARQMDILCEEAKNGIRAIYSWCVVLDANTELRPRYKTLIRAFMSEFIGTNVDLKRKNNLDAQDSLDAQASVARITPQDAYADASSQNLTDARTNTAQDRAKLILDSFNDLEAASQKEFDDLAEHIKQKRESSRREVARDAAPAGKTMMEVAPGKTMIISDEQFSAIRKLQDTYLPQIKPCELPVIPEENLSAPIRDARRAAPINNLSKLNKRSQEEVIGELWKRAESNVNSMLDSETLADKEMVGALINREADRLLADYLAK